MQRGGWGGRARESYEPSYEYSYADDSYDPDDSYEPSYEYEYEDSYEDSYEYEEYDSYGAYDYTYTYSYEEDGIDPRSRPPAARPGYGPRETCKIDVTEPGGVRIETAYFDSEVRRTTKVYSLPAPHRHNRPRAPPGVLRLARGGVDWRNDWADRGEEEVPGPLRSTRR